MTTAPAIKLLLRRLLAAESPAERFRAARELARAVRRLPRPKRVDLEAHLGDLLGMGMRGIGDGSLFSGGFLNPAGGLLADLVSRAGSGERIEWRRTAEDLIDRVLEDKAPPAPPPPLPALRDQDSAGIERAAEDGRDAEEDPAGRVPDLAAGGGATETEGSPAGAGTSDTGRLSTLDSDETSAETEVAAAASKPSESGRPAGTDNPADVEDSVEKNSEPPRIAAPKVSAAARAAAVGAPFSVAFVDRNRVAAEAPSSAAEGPDRAESTPAPRAAAGTARGADSVASQGAESSAARGADSVASQAAESSEARGADSIASHGAESRSFPEARSIPACGATRAPQSGAGPVAAGSADSILPSDAESARRRETARSPAAGIRRFVAGASRWDEATRRRELATLPDWAARRALCAAIRSAALTEPEEILALIAALSSPAARHWCLGELLAAHPLGGALLDRALELATPAARRRLLARGRRTRASRISACRPLRAGVSLETTPG